MAGRCHPLNKALCPTFNSFFGRRLLEVYRCQEQAAAATSPAACNLVLCVTPSMLPGKSARSANTEPDAGQEQQQPPSGLQPHNLPGHRRGSKHAARKDASALDMDTLAEASAAASLLTVLLELQLPADMQTALHPVLRSAICLALTSHVQGAPECSSMHGSLSSACLIPCCHDLRTQSVLMPASALTAVAFMFAEVSHRS